MLSSKEWHSSRNLKQIDVATSFEIDLNVFWLNLTTFSQKILSFLGSIKGGNLGCSYLIVFKQIQMHKIKRNSWYLDMIILLQCLEERI